MPTYIIPLSRRAISYCHTTQFCCGGVMVDIIKFNSRDTEELVNLFYETVHTVNGQGIIQQLN
ncbi:hypothetical protein [Lentibacillus daqui]|uniref:hypothetical protein n=1 Tax=Lentibacillus daqui TaxID=2911514 RepID=UPI0022B1E678|nr:hypothetical protein [Lentibacillus daqui]